MTLRQLTGLERQRIHDEYTDILDRIAEYRAILANETLLTDIIRTELETLKEKYGDERQTEITDEVKEFKVEDLIADEDMVVTLSPQRLYQTVTYGYLSETAPRWCRY